MIKKNIVRHILLILFCIGGGGLDAIAQIGTTIKGKVLNGSGVPIEYVHIVISSSPDSIVIASGTFVNGDFEFAGLDKGRYDIAFSCFEYITKVIPIVVADNTVDMGDIAMQPEIHQLKQITVTANRPLFKQEHGKLIVNVDNTILSESGSLIDLLKRSPGLIVDANDKISVFGRGVPIIYINDKEIISPSELESLRSTDIDRIEIDRNPSSQYSAAGHAVLKIITKRAKADKISLMLYDNLVFSRKISNIIGIQLDHKSGKWANLLSYSFVNTNHLDYNKSYEVNTQPDYTIYNDGDITNEYSNDGHNIFSGNEYNINASNKIGLQFSGMWNDGVSDKLTYQAMRRTGDQNVLRRINQRKSSSNHLYNTNVSYQHNPDSVNTFSLTLGYAYMDSNADNLIHETELADNMVQNSRTKSKSVYSVYSAKADYGFRLWNFAEMKSGVKYSQIIDEGKSNHWNTDTGTLDYFQDSRINDKIAAAYFEFTKEMGDFSVSGGLRYEYTSSKTAVDEGRIDTAYNSVFPSLMIDYSKNKLNISLSYSRRIGRPSFDQINPNMVYFDALSYGIGNPFLKPTYSNNIELNFSIHDIGFIAGYTFKKDYIDHTAVNDPVNPDITRWSFSNIDRVESFMLGVTYAKSWRIFSIGYEAYVEKPHVRVHYLNEEIVLKKPIWHISLSNTLNITKNLIFNIDFDYQSAGEDGITFWQSTWNLTAGILWKLFDNRLVLSLNANDIFKTVNLNTWEDRYGNIITGMKSNQDYRYLRIGIRYNFNNIRSGIRKRQSNTEEIERLK